MGRRCLALLFAAVLSAQDWADRAEYDLALGVRAQAAAPARLALLDQWKQKYPNSALKQMRSELALEAAQSIGDRARIVEIARELVAADANHFNGLYWLTLLTPATPAPSAAALAEADAFAKRLLKSAETFFSAGAGKLAGDKQKTEVLALAHRTLGWVEWRRNALDAAEKELRTSLELAPRSAEVSAWLGAVLAVQKQPEKQMQGMWQLARASYLDGDGALGAGQRRDVRSLLEASYGGYHGGLDGLDEIGAAAREAVNPPATFKVETAVEIALRKADEEMEKSNPQLFAWVKIRRALTGPNGEAEYAKLAAAPLPLLKGYVIRCDADPKPTQVVLGLQDSSVDEIVLQFGEPLARCAEVGVAVEFQGKPEAIVREPFLLTLAVDGKALQGWPAPPEKK